jgi:hypothetical protein
MLSHMLGKRSRQPYTVCCTPGAKHSQWAVASLDPPYPWRRGVCQLDLTKQRGTCHYNNSSNPSTFTSSIRIRTNHTIEPLASLQSALRGRHTPSLCCALLYRRRAAESFAQPWDRRYLYIAACHRPCSKVSLGSLTTSGNLFSQSTTTPATAFPQTATSITRPAQTNLAPHTRPFPTRRHQSKAPRFHSIIRQTKATKSHHHNNGLQRTRGTSSLIPSASLRRRPLPTAAAVRFTCTTHGRAWPLRTSSCAERLLWRPAARLQPATHAVPATAYVPSAGLPATARLSSARPIRG